MFSSQNSQGFSEGSYIDDLFSTYLYTGNGSTQTITNNIDLAGKGGLTWIKSRSAATDHALYDVARGATYDLASNQTTGQTTQSTGLTAFNSNGFSLGALAKLNTNNALYTSWTFRDQPKFFDVVTYTGTGVARTVAHNLGSTPGSIIIKRTDTSGNAWYVYHRSLGATQVIFLNQTDAATTVTSPWNDTEPTSTVFTVGANNNNNASGGTFVAYLFAHNAGGFGLTGTENAISCGSYTGNGLAAGPTITLGYEPQWILIKRATGTATNWTIFDNMRGLALDVSNSVLYPNLTSAEVADTLLNINSTGFQTNATGASINASGATYIYIAIRRPMKVPTVGTSVFAPIAYTGTNVDNRLVNTGIATDMTMARIRTATSTGSFYTADRLRGNAFLGTAITDAENTDADSFMTPTIGYGNSFSAMNGFGVGNDVTRQLNQSSTSQLAYAFKRAPGFFDEVCYTGTASNPGVLNHNLTVAPELMIVKTRSNVNYFAIYSSSLGNTKSLLLPDTGAAAVRTTWNNTSPTATTFTVENDSRVYFSGYTYVAYLFATVAGVSKVGSYTGTAALQTVACGFTSGARFVLIKRTDSTGDWYVWDSARGISSGTDPYLLLNSTAAEVTANNYVDTDSTGFKVTAAAPAALNASGGTYIFLAIA